MDNAIRDQDRFSRAWLNEVGILLSRSLRSPVSVTLTKSGDDLIVTRANHDPEPIPFRHLYRVLDEGSQLHLGRKGQRGWRLRTNGPTAEALRPLILRHPKWRWRGAKFWHVALFIGTVLLVELVKLPVEWIAPIVPSSLERRLAPADLRSTYGSYCTSPAGERALRQLIGRFDPAIARRVRIEVLNEGAFIISSLPGDRLVIYLPMLNEIEPDAFAALLAHEVAHLQRRDAVEAALRGKGTLGALVGGLFERRQDHGLQFSQEQEREADRGALYMLLRANISPIPATELFDRMETARQRNEPFGKDQYYLHWGLYSERAKRWRDIPPTTDFSRTRPAMTREQEDALFNYCWRHKGPPRTPYPKRPPPPQKRSN